LLWFFHDIQSAPKRMTRFFAIGLSILAVAAAWRWLRRSGATAELRNETLSRRWLTEFHAGDRT
jgi:hypothetical protein